MMRHGFRFIFVLIFAVFLLSLILLTYLDTSRKVVVSRFPRDRWPNSQWLTEQIAIESTRECLAIKYHNADEWIFLPDERTIAPDGSRDYALCRNIENPNRGFLAIKDPKQGLSNIAIVEMTDTNVRVEIVLPK